MTIKEYMKQVYEEMCKEARVPLLIGLRGDSEPDIDFDRYHEQISRHYHLSVFLPDAEYIAFLTHHWIVRLKSCKEFTSTEISKEKT